MIAVIFEVEKDIQDKWLTLRLIVSLLGAAFARRARAFAFSRAYATWDVEQALRFCTTLNLALPWELAWTSIPATLAQEKIKKLVRADITRTLPLETGQFDHVTMLAVLEHLVKSRRCSVRSIPCSATRK